MDNRYYIERNGIYVCRWCMKENGLHKWDCKILLEELENKLK